MSEPPAWERQSNEPNHWFNRFRRYLTLSGKRSLLAAYSAEQTEKARKSPTKSLDDKKGRPTSCPRDWRIAFKQWCWEERAAAWDACNRELELERWQESRMFLRQQEWEAAQIGIKKANEMLKLPVVKATTQDGKTVIEPGKWTFRDAIAILVESSNLARKSIGMDEDLLAKRQLGMLYDLLRQMLTLDEGTTITEVKSLVHAHLEAVLIELGKPVPGVRSVLEAGSDRSPIF